MTGYPDATTRGLYRDVLDAVPGEDARRLAHDLERWHGPMETHRLAVQRLGFDPDGHPEWTDCPHAEARRLWARAEAVLGADASTFTFLRACSRGLAPGATEEKMS